MSILGSLIVELRANTAAFIEGLSGAAKTARSTGREIESSFSSLGNIAATALAPFGMLGSTVAMTLGQVGSAAGGAMISMGKMGGAMGLVAAAGAGAGAALGAVALASLGIASAGAMSIAKMGELAQVTGVSVKELSGLAFVGKTVGIETEQMAKALTLMDKSVFKAATTAAGTATVYSRLGISVRDASGQIRPTSAVIADLGEKFSAMADGPVKTALALQALGRGGAVMIPMLNLGKEKIQELLETAQALGLVLDDQTVQSAMRFKESLETIEAAGTGLQYRLTRELLPALETVTRFLVDGLKDKNSGINDVIASVVWLTKAFLGVGETIWAVLKQIGLFVGNTIAYFVELASGIYEAMARAAHFDWSGAVSAFADSRGRMKAIDNELAVGSAQIWNDNSKFIKGVFGPMAPGQKRLTGGTGGIDTGADKGDKAVAAIEAQIAALRGQAAAELAVAAATAGSLGQQQLVEAEGKANEIVAKLTAQADKAAGAEKQKLLDLIKKLTPEIHKLTLEQLYAKDAVATGNDLRKQNEAMDRQIEAARQMAEAYRQGGAAIAEAGIDKQLAAETQKVSDLGEKFAILSHNTNLTKAEFEQAEAAFRNAATALDLLRQKAIDAREAKYSEEIEKQSYEFSAQKPLLDALNAAYLQNDEAIRQAQVHLAQLHWEEAHPGATASQIAAVAKELDEESRAARDAQYAQEAGQFSLSRLYDEQIVKLERVREVIQLSGQSTLLVDAAIYEANNRLIQQWDAAALKVGSLREKFTAFLNEIILQGQNLGEKVFGALLQTLDRVEDEIAKLLTGQKTNFKAIFQQLAQSVIKAEIQSVAGKAVSAIEDKLGIKLPGLHAKADGSSSNPFYVIVAGGGGAAAGAAGGGGLLGAFASLFGGNAEIPGTGQTAGELSALGYSRSDIGTMLGGGGAGGFLSGLGSIFGGFLADGGDLSPGRWYVAGEKGPEIVSSKSGGSVTPAARGTTVTNNFNFTQGKDIFRRSAAQETARQFHRQASLAYSRA